MRTWFEDLGGRHPPRRPGRVQTRRDVSELQCAQLDRRFGARDQARRGSADREPLSHRGGHCVKT
jgi:hypothetical protein